MLGMARERKGVWKATEGNASGTGHRAWLERVGPAWPRWGVCGGVCARHGRQAGTDGSRSGNGMARASGVRWTTGLRIGAGGGGDDGRGGGPDGALGLGPDARRGDGGGEDRCADRDSTGPARAGRGGVQRTKSARQPARVLRARAGGEGHRTQRPGLRARGTHDGGATA